MSITGPGEGEKPRREDPPEAPGRKPYTAPVVVDLGDFTKLTRGIPGPQPFVDFSFPEGGQVEHDDFS